MKVVSGKAGKAQKQTWCAAFTPHGGHGLQAGFGTGRRARKNGMP